MVLITRSISSLQVHIRTFSIKIVDSCYILQLLLHLCMREISPFSTLPMNQKEDVFLVFMIIRVRVRDLCCVFLFKGTNDITSILEWHISHCYNIFLRWKEILAYSSSIFDSWRYEQFTALINFSYEYRYIFCWAMFYHFGTFYSNKSMLSQWRQRHCFVWIKLTLKISCYFFCYYFLMYVQSVKFFYYACNNKYKKIFEHVGLRKQQNPT